MLLGQLVAAGDIVVVDMSLSNVSDSDSMLCENFLNSIKIALRVNNECANAIVDHVTAISQSD
jgi:hypothetical protein